MEYKSGFVSIIGRPNVGKSTLLNNIVGEKVAIMSDKPQTTRNTIQAVYTSDEFQIVFLDTPGIHKPKNKLGEMMLKSAKDAYKNVDCIVFVVDDSKTIGKGDFMIIDSLKNNKIPVFLVINKIDKIKNKEELLELISTYDELGVFSEIIPVSALKNSNIDSLINALSKKLEVGPKYFPDDLVTDQPERVLISELIREKVLLYTDDEVPHGVVVEIESIKKRKNKNLLDVNAVIYCERDSHKGIIIGKGGRKLKGIGVSAREEIEFLMDTQINLQLWVKVKENWRNLPNYINNFGLNENK